LVETLACASEEGTDDLLAEAVEQLVKHYSHPTILIMNIDSSKD